MNLLKLLMMMKYNMKYLKIKNYLIFSFIFLMSSFLFGNQVLAEGVIINYETDPLFSDLNILPGDKSVKWVNVDNGLDEDLLVRVVVDSYEDLDSLGSQMGISITSGLEIFYNGALKDFFDDGGADLLSISPKSVKQYDFKINFFNATGNEYQGKSLEFDISITVTGEKSGTSQSVSTSGSRSSSFIEPRMVPIVKGEDGFPELFISKESSLKLMNSGGQIEYTVNIENRGNLAAYDAVLKDDLPDGFYFSSTGENEKTWNLF